MIIVISPAKTLDLSEDTRYIPTHSMPQYLEDTQQLVGQLAQMSGPEIGKMMSISEDLAKLNHQRYQSFSLPFHPENAKQALMTFNGDVYKGFDLAAYTEEDFAFAQDHLRILSGLYGLLKPLDLIQPYRLEMGTRLQNERGKDLYAFWGDKLRTDLEESLEGHEHKTLINLASHEYNKAINLKKFGYQLITPTFKEIRDGGLKIISFFAKQARGSMSDFIIKNRLTKPEELKDFDGMGYAFDEGNSTQTDWVFTRVS